MERQKNLVWGKTLTSPISQTWEFIVKKADDEAMEGLSLVHSLLIKPVETFVKCCQRLMLSVHEQLALLPFAALFDKQSERFCIQDRTISYIPSICVLHYCLHWQGEQQVEMGLLKTPLIACNPEPMGWGKPSLPVQT
jgi:CHAT domain-containing protein